MKVSEQKQSLIFTIIGMIVVIIIVLVVSVLVYMKYKNDVKKDIETEKQIALEVVKSIENELGSKMNSNPNYIVPITCTINSNGNICHNKEKNESYNINVDSDKKPSGGLIKLTSIGISNSSTIEFKNRIYTLQLDGNFELN